MLDYLARRVPGIQLQGLELDAGALSRAQGRCPGVPLVRADVYALPFDSEAFDLVLCLEVLEHLPEPAQALREIRRVTRRDVLLSVPHEPFFRLGNALRGQHIRRLGDPEDHVQHWGAGSFARLCAEHLTVRSCTSAFPWLLLHGSV